MRRVQREPPGLRGLQEVLPERQVCRGLAGQQGPRGSLGLWGRQALGLRARQGQQARQVCKGPPERQAQGSLARRVQQALRARQGLLARLDQERPGRRGLLARQGLVGGHLELREQQAQLDRPAQAELREQRVLVPQERRGLRAQVQPALRVRPDPLALRARPERRT